MESRKSLQSRKIHQLILKPVWRKQIDDGKMMKWCDQAYGMRYVALRYFNVAGAKADASIGEDHTPETHLVPIILQVALAKEKHWLFMETITIHQMEHVLEIMFK